MSLKYECEEGFIICHESYVNYETNLQDSRVSRIKLKSDLFDINTPFLMDSQAKKLANTQTDTCENKRKRKRRKHKTNQNNQLVVDMAKSIINNSNYFMTTKLTSELIEDNNRTARNNIATLSNQINFVDFCQNKPKPDELPHYFELPMVNSKIEDILPCLIANNNKNGTSLKIQDEEFLIPSNSSFILADLNQIENILLQNGEKYDVIVLDPPWENKSIKRMKKYPMLSNERLKQIPVTSLSNEDCLVIVWVTNNTEQNNFVRDTLFPYWSVTYVTEWHWVKVTKTGEFAIPLHSPNKSIYENLIIGRCNTTNSTKEIKTDCKVVISIPSLIHSHKPPITEILKQFVKNDFKGLEIFARYLLPTWTSCGNEVIESFSDKKYFYK